MRWAVRRFSAAVRPMRGLPLERAGARCYDRGAMENERAPAILAIVRIVSLLAMSLAIALGIFLLLGGWWLTSVISFLAAIPFFFLMRYLEKRYARDDG